MYFFHPAKVIVQLYKHLAQGELEGLTADVYLFLKGILDDEQDGKYPGDGKRAKEDGV